MIWANCSRTSQLKSRSYRTTKSVTFFARIDFHVNKGMHSHKAMATIMLSLISWMISVPIHDDSDSDINRCRYQPVWTRPDPVTIYMMLRYNTTSNCQFTFSETPRLMFILTTSNLYMFYYNPNYWVIRAIDKCLMNRILQKAQVGS